MYICSVPQDRHDFLFSQRSTSWRKNIRSMTPLNKSRQISREWRRENTNFDCESKITAEQLIICRLTANHVFQRSAKLLKLYKIMMLLLPIDEERHHHIILVIDFCHSFKLGQEANLEHLKSLLFIPLTKCLKKHYFTCASYIIIIASTESDLVNSNLD